MIEKYEHSQVSENGHDSPFLSDLLSISKILRQQEQLSATNFSLKLNKDQSEATITLRLFDKILSPHILAEVYDVFIKFGWQFENIGDHHITFSKGKNPPWQWVVLRFLNR